MGTPDRREHDQPISRLVEQADDRGAQLRGVHVLGDQTQRELVTATQDAEHDVLAADHIVLLRQGFSQGELQHLFSGLGEREVPAATPAPTGLAQRIVVGAGTECPVHVVADCPQVDADRPQRLGVVLEGFLDRRIRGGQPVADHRGGDAVAAEHTRQIPASAPQDTNQQVFGSDLARIEFAGLFLGQHHRYPYPASTVT